MKKYRIEIDIFSDKDTAIPPFRFKLEGLTGEFLEEEIIRKVKRFMEEIQFAEKTKKAN